MNRRSYAKTIISALAVMFLFLSVVCARAVEIPERTFKGPDVVGEAFGRPVKSGEFNYYMKTALLFSRSGNESRTEDEARVEAWQNLAFREGAKEQGLTVPREELEAEIGRLVGEKGLTYGTPQYQMWVMTELRDDVNTFERRLEDLLLINKLLKLKTDPEIIVTEDEMEQKYRNQYSSFESEYIRFDTEDEAKDFLDKLETDKGLWKKTYDEKKPEGQKGATWINIMSLEALIDLWRIPKEDAYRILEMEPGDFTTAKFFYGDAVFRLMRKKKADMEKYDDKKKEYYRKMMTRSRKYKIGKEYLDDLFGRAKLRDYVAEKRHLDKVENMKKRSEVVIETSKGNIKIKLFPEEAPLACENFLGLMDKGYFDGHIFHRVIKDFMIQTGDPTGSGSGGDSIWDKPFADEVSEDLKFDRPGLLAMANSGANTNKSQFFITVKPTEWLNGKHTIFGEVTEGLDIVQEINSVETDARDKPKEEQKMIKVHEVAGDKD